jgi:hypothetical protein
LVDATKLASILGEVPHAARVRSARQALAARIDEHPVLVDVIACWEKLRKVRGTGPDDAANWAMACDVIAYCRAQVTLGATETPVRDASSRLFKDSKRIESLSSRIDVLLAGNVEDDARGETEVLEELGLFREPQPARLAGNVVVRRERGAFTLDRPYCALPPSTVLGLGSIPRQVLTIENLTTFHVWARQHCDTNVLCLYTAGMPSPAWRAMYVRLLSGLPAETQVLHWGDIDEGGFRIAAVLSRCAGEAGHTLLPWKMRPADVPEMLRRSAPARTIERMVKYARRCRVAATSRRSWRRPSSLRSKRAEIARRKQPPVIVVVCSSGSAASVAANFPYSAGLTASRWTRLLGHRIGNSALKPNRLPRARDASLSRI